MFIHKISMLLREEKYNNSTMLKRVIKKTLRSTMFTNMILTKTTQIITSLESKFMQALMLKIKKLEKLHASRKLSSD